MRVTVQDNDAPRFSEALKAPARKRRDYSFTRRALMSAIMWELESALRLKVIITLLSVCLGLGVEPIYPPRRAPPKLYLPPDSPAFVLPEVIDNRARIPVNTVSIASVLNGKPALELEAPFANSAADFYPIYAFGRGSADQTQNHEVLLPSTEAQVHEMSCQNSAEELYFRASLSPPRDYSADPLIDAAAASGCKIGKLAGGAYRLDLGREDFWRCGVIDCSTGDSAAGRHYCLGLRFPRIAGLRLRDDLKLTLQCRTQERVASHTRRINLKSIDTSARMAARVASGGRKGDFETDVAIYRKSFAGGAAAAEHVFDSKIEPGGTLLLGEEILLRAAVREGDGWKYSKLSEVTVHYVEKRQRKRTMNSLWILDQEGCVNPQLREVSPGEQYRVGPLESYLLFKAFMFESMSETDELVLSVKVTACLSGEDCLVNCPAGQHSRRTRGASSVGNGSSSGTTHDWENRVSFRVRASVDEVDFRGNSSLLYAGYALILGTIVLLACLVEFLARRRRRRRRT